ncbi:MAG TPA: carbohydrate-binding protein [Chthoniobacteraceae bacterium]|nr:carbohydrate-binding protein [Chthoniobacteraceae bacterium]
MNSYRKLAVFVLATLILSILTPELKAQLNTNLTVKIPIKKDRRYYDIISEDGKSRACGVKLYAVWDVYKNYTNLNSYRYTLTGIQNPGAAYLVVEGERKYFEVYCYFNGRDGGNTPDVDCHPPIGESLPEWEATLTRTPPQASFTTTFNPATPGEVKFQSTSKDPEDPQGNALRPAWQFGDEGTGSTDIEVHRYTKPGRFNAKLTVTNPDGLVGTATREVRIAAPRPLVSMQLFNKHSQNRIEPGEQFRMRVSVQASTDGVGSLTNLAFNGPLLTVPDVFNVLSAPAQTNIGNLQPGEKKEFEWTLKTVGVGNFTLASASVTGRDEAGQNVFGAGATQRGEITALIVGIEQQPKQVLLNRDNNGDGKTNSLDNQVQIIVSVTNVINIDITDVHTTVTNDPISLISLASTPNIDMIATNTVAGVFGTIPSGESRSITNTYEAWGRVYAEAQSVVHGKVDGVPVEEAGKGPINVGGETLLEARFDIEDRPYMAGQVVRVFGSLKNVSRLTSNRGEIVDEGKTVGVVIYPTVEGNGVGGYAFLKGSGGRTPDGPTAFMVAPDETVEISAIIPTAEVITNTPLAITYQVVGYVHGEGPKPRRARPGEIEVVEKKLSEGWSAQHDVELAGVPEIKDQWLTCPTELSIAGFVSCRFTEGLGNAGGSMAGLVMLTGAGLREIGLGSIRMMGWGLWAMEQTLKGLEDPAARARLATEIIHDLQALKQVGVESAQAIDVAVDNVGPAIERAIIETGRTLESGDFKQIAGGLARITGENIDIPFEGLIAARAVRKAMLVREGAESAAKQALEESFERQARELGGTVDDYAARGALSDLPTSDDLPTGINVRNDPRVYRDAYGSRKEEVDAYLAVAKEEGLIMGWRSRSPRSAELLDRIPPTHLLKPHGVSIKTVNEIDIKYLNYPETFEAECVLVEPPIPWVKPWIDKDKKIPTPEFVAAADNYLQRFPDLNVGTDASKALREQVYERLAHQMHEWPKQAENFVKYSRDGIDVNFHAQKQNVGLGKFLLPNNQARRSAQLEPGHFIDPLTGERRNTYRLLMDDGTGKFKPITGDTDFLFMLNPDGTVPSLLKRIRAYSKMIRLGLQHGESFSFSIQSLREGWLRCCTPRASGGEGEKMLAATPYGELLTTQFKDALSVIEGGDNSALKIGKGEFAFLEGTLTEVNTLERTASEAVPKAILHEVVPLVTVAALIRMADELKAEADRSGGQAIRMGPDGLPEIYDHAPESTPAPLPVSIRRAPSLRAAAAGPEQELLGILEGLADRGWISLREVPPPGAAGGQWRPATKDEARGGLAGAGLKLSPYTYITEDLQAGTSVLPVLSDEEIGWPVGTPAFAVGDQVVIDPGGLAEEFATIVSLWPFTLSRPLQNLQEAGTMVLFLSGMPNTTALAGALPAPENLLVWLRADAGIDVSGTNIISWTDQTRNNFVFSAPSETTRPAWMPSVNGKPAAVRISGGANAHLRGNLGRTLTNATIFTLVRFLDTGSGSRYLYSFGTRNFSGLMMTAGRQGGNAAFHYDGAATQAAGNTVTGTNNFFVFSQVFGQDSPDHHRLMVNATEVLSTRTTVGRAYSAIATNIYLGTSPGYGAFGGDLVEWLVYDRVLSVEERFEVEEYLRQRADLGPFIIPGSLDLSHSEVVQYNSSSVSNATFTFGPANREIRQMSAGDPTISLYDFDTSDQVIHTKLSASAGSGAMGVVFGYQDRGWFHLIDWRQTSSNRLDWGTAPAGIRLRSFHLPEGEEPTGADFWSGSDTNRVTTWRTSDTPWEADREYDLVLSFEAEQTVIEIKSRGVTLVAWSVPELKAISGRFGHYAEGLSDARFGPLLLPGAAPAITAIEPGPSGNWNLRWVNGAPPFLIESTSDLHNWYPVAPTTLNYSHAFPITDNAAMFRIRSAGVVTEEGAGGGGGQTFGNGGNPWLIERTEPTRIEAENFDEGGPEIAYHDNDPANRGGAYRSEGVDIQATTDAGGGFNLGWIEQPGEWLEYTIDVAVAGMYQLRFRTARQLAGTSTIRAYVDGVDKTGDITIPSTGGWQTWETVTKSGVSLEAGIHYLRIELVGTDFNLNWIEIAP